MSTTSVAQANAAALRAQAAAQQAVTAAEDAQRAEDAARAQATVVEGLSVQLAAIAAQWDRALAATGAARDEAVNASDRAEAAAEVARLAALDAQAAAQQEDADTGADSDPGPSLPPVVVTPTQPGGVLTSVLFDYGRTQPASCTSIRHLRLRDEQGLNALAAQVWTGATYLSGNSWVKADVVTDVTAPGTQLPEAPFDYVIGVPPTADATLLSPGFWQNAAAWLKPGGAVIALASDSAVGAYLTDANQYETFYRMQATAYEQLLDADRALVDDAFARMRGDVVAWTGHALLPAPSADLPRYVVDTWDFHRALVFLRS